MNIEISLNLQKHSPEMKRRSSWCLLMHVREVHETLPSQTTLKAFFKFDDGEADEYFPGSG
jgi:hypothetical protein